MSLPNLHPNFTTSLNFYPLTHTCRYSALNVKDLDDVPLMSEDGGAGEGGDSEDEESTLWEAGGSRTRWKRRIRSHTTLVSLFFNGGWLVVLKK